MDYDNGMLVVQFRRTLRAAGQPTTYVHNVTPGTAGVGRSSTECSGTLDAEADDDSATG